MRPKTGYEFLKEMERRGCSIVEVKEQSTGHSAIAATHPDGVSIFPAGRDWRGDGVITPEDFNLNYEIKLIITDGVMFRKVVKLERKISFGNFCERA